MSGGAQAQPDPRARPLMTLEGARELLNERIRTHRAGSTVDFSVNEATAILNLLNEWAKAYKPDRGPHNASW